MRKDKKRKEHEIPCSLLNPWDRALESTVITFG